MKAQTKEAQYQVLLKLAGKEGLEQFGLMSSQVWHDDPRRLDVLEPVNKRCRSEQD